MAANDPRTEPKITIDNATETPIEVQKEGFTILAKGVDAIADVVFIHGLRGHPRDTWTFDLKSNNLLSSVFKKKPKELDGIYWPKDIFEHDFQNVRIISYGYDSHFTGSFGTTANQSGISDHGQDLLSGLEHIRRADPKRPLIFVAHSLGGLVVKEALRRSRGSGSNKAYLKDIYLSTHAIIFFGTPHRGSSYARLGQVYELVAGSVISTNKVLLEELKPNAQFLKVLREEFGSMIQEKAFEVYCFQEGKPMSNLSSKLVVNADSSCLDDGWESRAIINTHHRAMCRFATKSDPGYVKFEGVISRYLEDIQKKSRLESQKCLKSLRSPAMYERRDLIEYAEAHTFEWIFTESRTGFKDWLVKDEPMFWIRGKPGSGKSTLLKYLCQHEATFHHLKSQRLVQVATAGYYFYDQASHLAQKTFRGLLQGILHELLATMPEIFPIIVDIYEKTCCSDGWMLAELMSAFTTIGQQKTVSGCICLFIDALDEYGGSPTEIVRELRQLLMLFTKGTLRIKICASSRLLPEFETMLGGSPGFAIHDWTSNDIRQVVSQRLGEAERGPMADLSESIVLEAKGVFLWVKLIIKELSPYIFDGASERELILRLSNLPRGLETFYCHLLARIVPAKQPKIRSILQMITCDGNRMHPLSLAELSLAAELTMDSTMMTHLQEFDSNDVLTRCRDMERRLTSNLSGFLELVPNGKIVDSVPPHIFAPLNEEEYSFLMQNVRFSHKTAREYFFKKIKCDFFELECPLNNQLAGHIRLIRLYTHLAKFEQPGCYLNYHWTKKGLDLITIHDTEIVDYFAHHAWEAEYYDYVSASNRKPIRHDLWGGIYIRTDATSLNIRSRVIKGPQEAAVLSKEQRITLMEDFDQSISSHDPDWFSNRLCPDEDLAPCLLTFALFQGLFSYARDIIDDLKPSSINRYDPPLLYWTIKSLKNVADSTALGILDEDIQRAEDFVRYLLKAGADPNSVFKVPYTQSIHGFYELQGMAEISILHFILGLDVSTLDTQLTNAYRRIICSLLEGGADPGETKYKNYWSPLKGTPHHASALHWLSLSLNHIHRGGNLEGDPDPFAIRENGKLLCNTIKTFLDYGANPNAVDSAGMDVLTSFMCTSSYAIVEHALEKGALITPLLLDDDGSPFRRHGILWEDRWRRPECYTPQAREIVRKHMPHWEDAEDEVPAEDEAVQDEVVEETSNDGGLVTMIHGLLGWGS